MATKKRAKKKAVTKRKAQSRSMIGRKASASRSKGASPIQRDLTRQAPGPLAPKIDPVTGMPVGLETETQPATGVPRGVTGLKKKKR